jgi:hypothetical protein
MRHLRIGLALSLAASLAAPFLVTEASAQRFGGMGGGRGPGGSARFGSPPHMVQRPPNHRPFVSQHASRHRFHHRGGAFGTFGGVGTPLWVYPSQPVYYGSPGYAAPPGYYGAPAVSAPPVVTVMSVQPAAPRPVQTEVEFSTGRYELRGDGAATPYVWVWVPNPPLGPPSDTPPPSEGGRPRRQDLYRWTDEQGVLHLTDRLELVPPEQRPQAKSPS